MRTSGSASSSGPSSRTTSLLNRSLVRYAFASATDLNPCNTCTSSSRTSSALDVAPAAWSRNGCLYFMYTPAAAERFSPDALRVISSMAIMTPNVSGVAACPLLSYPMVEWLLRHEKQESMNDRHNKDVWRY